VTLDQIVAIVVFRVALAMRRAHILPRGIPRPAVFPSYVQHPRYGLQDGNRVIHCLSDAEVVTTITELWRPLPADTAMDPPLNQEEEA
jgi:hypothetical protein